MPKLEQKTLFILLITVFFVFGRPAEAGIVINEIAWMGNQENPNAEWFEILNTGLESIDISGLTVTLPGGSLITVPNGTFILPQDFFTFGRQPKDNNITYSYLPNFSPDLIYSGTLPNTPGIISLSSGDSVEYGLSERDGYNSEQRMLNGGWVYGFPTPGSKNISDNSEEETVKNDTDGNDKNEKINISESMDNKNKEIFNSIIKTKIISPKIVVAGVPFMIDHETIGHKGEKIIFDRFVWNFGDGNAKEMNPGLPFEYTYFYPGDYALGLSYYETSFSKTPEAVSKLNIKVIPSGIKIVSVGDVSDPYLEIENDSSHEMILNNWSIKGLVKNFTIPDGTTILPNKKIKFSPKITGFNFEDLSSLTIVDEGGSIFAIYPKSKNLTTKKATIQTVTANKKDLLEVNNFETKNNNKKEVIDLNNLQASAHDSKENSSSGVIYFGLVSVVAIGVIAVLVIKSNKKEGLEGELSAKDIKIIE